MHCNFTFSYLFGVGFMNIYVGNLNYRTSSEDLNSEFEKFGAVISAKIVSDRDTGRSKGYGFVEMSDEEGAEAIKALNDALVGGRNLRVNEAKPRN